jgi:hypothetical protein
LMQRHPEECSAAWEACRCCLVQTWALQKAR